ncbi:Uncharacterised protein [uncultured archaeon]|nr:Uncharacterised protein [uncultured archaeon]
MEFFRQPPQFRSSKTSGSSAFSAAGTPFFRSQLQVKDAVRYEDKLLLLSAYKIAVSMLGDSELSNGHYKLKFEPSEGRKTKFIHRSLEHSDTTGIWFMKGSHNGKPIVAASMRRKLTTSEVQKTNEDLGGLPLVQVEAHQPGFESIGSLKKQLDSYWNSRDEFITHEKKEKLGILLGAATSEHAGQHNLLLEICGRDAANYRKIQVIFDDLGHAVSKTIELDRQRQAEYAAVDENLTLSKVVGAAALFPICGADANALADLMLKHRDSGLDWLKRYALKVMPRVLGVELLEYTSKNAIDAMEQLFRIAYETSDKKEQLSEKAKLFDENFHALVGLVDSVDAEMKKMKGWLTNDPEQWFSGLCRLSAKRSKILNHIQLLEGASAEVSHEKHISNQLRLMLANMAVNLCSVSREEIAMWNELYSNKKVAAFLKETKDGKAIYRKIRDFTEAAKDEAKNIEKFVAKASTEESEYKQKSEELSDEMVRHIRKLEGISPLAAKRLDDIYASSKRHVSYKQWERFSPNIQDAYFSRLSLLMLLRDKFEPARYERIERDYLQQNARLYSLFGENEQLRKEIMEDLQSLLYVQKKGFDLETYAGRLAKNRLGDTEVDVEYSLSVDPASKANILNLKFKNNQIPVELYSPLPYDPDYKLPIPESPPQRSPDEELYGKKYDLEQIIGRVSQQESLGTIYEKLFRIATANPEQYDKVKKKLETMDMESAHFLSTLTDREFQSGCVTNILGRNMPTLLSDKAENTLLSFLRQEYPDFDKDAMEVKDYIIQTLATRALNRLNSSLPYYMERCMEITVSDKPG